MKLRASSFHVGPAPRGWPLAAASALLLGALGCRHGAPAEPTPSGPAASRPASAPASRPASRPANLTAALTQTATLSAQRLRDHVYYLASDELEGRGPATAGLDKAAGYLVRSLRAAGLRPAFGERYRQPFEMLVKVEAGPANRLAAGKRSFARGADFAPYGFAKAGTIEAPLAFVGYGIRSKDHDYDDYAGLDVKGHLVVALAGEPGDDDPKSPFDGRRRTSHASLRSKLLMAREAGAAGLLVVAPEPKTPRALVTAEDAGLPVARISRKAARALLGFDPRAKGKAIDRDYQPRSAVAKGKAASLTVDLKRVRRTVHNVAAEIGPAEAEAVVLGAHYDHLGMGGADSLSGTDEPRVHNGADDNASGTAAVLEVARALAPEAAKMKRKLVFVLFAGEEDGLLGSSHFVKHPPMSIGRVAAMLNMDMVGRLRESRLNFMGVKTALELEDLARAAVKGRKLSGTFGGDGYGPSDHTPFFAAGVPVLFLFTGAHPEYHKPSDDPDTLNYPGLAKVAAVAADLMGALARAEGRPTYVEAKPPPKSPHGGGGGRGYGPYFGSIPDFGVPVKGVRFAGVRPGSPADEAGVKKGDVLVEFGGLAVGDLQDFTIALRRHAPGDTVEIKVQREGKTLTLKTTLTRRD